MLEISIVVGLVVMFLWGIADFLQSIVIRKVGEYKTMFIGNVLGFFVLIFFLFNENIFKIALPNLILLIVFGFSQVISFVNFYRSMKIGELSIVIPISASYPLVTVLMMILLLNAQLTLLTIIAIIVIVLGIVLTSTDLRKLKYLHKAKGVKESLIVLVVWGLYFFIISVVGNNTILFGINFPETHFMAVFFYTTIINGGLTTLYAIYKKGIPKKKDLEKKTFIIFIINTLIYTGAWIFLNYGMGVGKPALIAPISSIYPMITVMLAVIFYKEKLVLNQKIGILTILIGLFMISI